MPTTLFWPGVRWFTYICHRDGLCSDVPTAELRNGSGGERGTEPVEVEWGTGGQEGKEMEGREGGEAQDKWAWERVQALRSHPAVVARFHSLVREHFRGVLKPPFNTEAREKAGFAAEWYLPLAERDARGAPDTTLT